MNVYWCRYCVDVGGGGSLGWVCWRVGDCGVIICVGYGWVGGLGVVGFGSFGDGGSGGFLCGVVDCGSGLVGWGGGIGVCSG